MNNMFKSTILHAFILITIFFQTAFSAPQKLIIQGAAPLHYRDGKDKNQTARLLKVTLDADRPSTPTIEILSSANSTGDFFKVAGKRIILAKKRSFPQKGKKNNDSLTTTSLILTDEDMNGRRTALRSIDIRKITESAGVPDYNPIDLDISHDGRKIAFLFWKDMIYHERQVSSNAIFLYDLASGEMRQLTPWGWLCEKPVFSPDDSAIAFYMAPLEIWHTSQNGAENDKNGHRLCLVETRGSPIKYLTPPPNTIYPVLDSAPAWSPDGSKILFVAQYNDENTDRRALDSWGLYLYDLRASRFTRLSPVRKELTFIAYPSWSPDGARCCYVLGNKLIVQNIKTREIVELKTDPVISKCVWAPDRDLIAFAEADTRDSPNYKLSVISPDGKYLYKHIAKMEASWYWHNIYWMK